MADILLKERNLLNLIELDSKILLSGFCVSEDLEFIFCVAFDKGFAINDLNPIDFYSLNQKL